MFFSLYSSLFVISKIFIHHNHNLSEVHDNYSLTISETVDMINDQLMGAELKKKVIRNGIKLLKIIQNELVSEEIYELISNV